MSTIRLLAVMTIILIAFSGCGPSSGSQVQGGAESGNEFVIVTSFYPMYISTINITKGIPGVRVVNMTKPQTGCLHDYQLAPEDIRTLEKANAFVINGAGMESFLDKVLKQQPKLKIVEASKDIVLWKDQKGEENPHVWVSVTNAITQVRNISEQLASLDSAHAVQYKANADEYIQKLMTLSKEMHERLDNVPNKDIIVFHEAFPYFSKEFKLNIAGVIEREPGSEPTPKELQETIEQIKKLHIKALFAEPQYSAKAATMISQATGAKLYTLDPAVTGESKPDALDDYLNVMRNNAKVLQEALQ